MVKINYKYIASVSALIEELHQSLTINEKKHLKQLLDKLSLQDKQKIEFNIHNLLFEFIKASPGERAIDHKWNPDDNPEYNLFLAYYSFVYLQRAYYLMSRIHEIPDKNGYKEIIGAYAVIATDIRTKEFKESFFDEFLTFEEFNPKKKRIRKKKPF